MRGPLTFVLLLFVLSCGPAGPRAEADRLQFDFEDTAVPPEIRLEHYLAYARYPEDSRPAAEYEPVPRLEDWPGLPHRSRADAATLSGYGAAVLKNGSLVIPVQLDVRERGRYEVRSVLRDAKSGQALVVASAARTLAPGRHEIPLVFYGLILREGKHGGPFVLGGVIGERVLTEEELFSISEHPDANLEGRLELLEATYTSPQFRVEDFTDRPYDSPEKRRRVEALREEMKASRS